LRELARWGPRIEEALRNARKIDGCGWVAGIDAALVARLPHGIHEARYGALATEASGAEDAGRVCEHVRSVRGDLAGTGLEMLLARRVGADRRDRVVLARHERRGIGSGSGKSEGDEGEKHYVFGDARDDGGNGSEMCDGTLLRDDGGKRPSNPSLYTLAMSYSSSLCSYQ
jgi:hypothetical protein